MTSEITGALGPAIAEFDPLEYELLTEDCDECAEGFHGGLTVNEMGEVRCEKCDAFIGYEDNFDGKAYDASFEDNFLPW